MVGNRHKRGAEGRANGVAQVIAKGIDERTGGVVGTELPRRAEEWNRSEELWCLSKQSCVRTGVVRYCPSRGVEGSCGAWFEARLPHFFCMFMQTNVQWLLPAYTSIESDVLRHFIGTRPVQVQSGIEASDGVTTITKPRPADLIFQGSRRTFPMWYALAPDHAPINLASLFNFNFSDEHGQQHSLSTRTVGNSIVSC